MTIHNILEDIVIQKVKEVLDEQEASRQPKICTCYQCLLDITCYVLNNMRPQYIVSSRGAVRWDENYTYKKQKEADLISLIYQGIKQVSTAKRPNFTHFQHTPEPVQQRGNFFNIPTIIGRVFLSPRLEPADAVQVSLYYCGQLVEMINPNWPNPLYITDKTVGKFSFWPRPRETAGPHETADFELEIVAEKKGYETLHRFFTVNVQSEDSYIDYFKVSPQFIIEDLFLIDS